LILALVALFSFPAQAVFDVGDEVPVSTACEGRETVMELSREDEKDVRSATALFNLYLSEGKCAAFPIRAVKLVYLVHVYTDSKGIISEIWRVETRKLEIFVIVVDPRQRGSI